MTSEEAYLASRIANDVRKYVRKHMKQYLKKQNPRFADEIIGMLQIVLTRAAERPLNVLDESTLIMISLWVKERE